MKISPLLTLFLLLFFTCALPQNAFAQFTNLIGTSKLTKQRFSCRTYPKGQDVLVKKNGKTKKVSKKRGNALVKTSLNRVARMISNTRSLLKEKKVRLRKLQKSSSIVLPKVEREILNLKDNVIPKLERRIVTIQTYRSELLFIRRGIKRCGKTALYTGTNQIFSGSADGPKTGEQYYLLAARYVFSYSGSIPQIICTEIDGKIGSSAWSKQACCNAYDGTGTSNPFTFCADTDLLNNQGMIGLGGACGKFSSGRYDNDFQSTNQSLTKIVRVFLPDKSGGCS